MPPCPVSGFSLFRHPSHPPNPRADLPGGSHQEPLEMREQPTSLWEEVARGWAAQVSARGRGRRLPLVYLLPAPNLRTAEGEGQHG